MKRAAETNDRQVTTQAESAHAVVGFCTHCSGRGHGHGRVQQHSVLEYLSVETKSSELIKYIEQCVKELQFSPN